MTSRLRVNVKKKKKTTNAYLTYFQSEFNVQKPTHLECGANAIVRITYFLTMKINICYGYTLKIIDFYSFDKSSDNLKFEYDSEQKHSNII